MMRPILIVVILLAMTAVCAQLRAETVHSVFPVPSVTLYPGDKLTANVLVERRFRLRKRVLASYVREKKRLVGMIARRTLVAGRPIARNGVRVDNLITEGSRVSIVFRSGRLSITSTAIAMQSGGVGDVISVRNVDSGVTVRGTIGDDGAINVGAL